MAFTLTDTDLLIIKVLLKDGPKSFQDIDLRRLSDNG